MYKLVMFDGQHKSIASWITGRKTVVFKVYIDFPRENAVRLVNSIQAKIRKLPLSPFELAAKMAEEWQDRLADYEKVLGDKCSEDGFLNWVEKDERARAKAAFADALIQNIIESQDLAFNKYVASPGAQPKGIQITQSAFRNKVLRRLLREEPLKEVFSRSQALRNIEAENIVRLLNIFVAHAFEPAGKELTEHERTRAKRVTYQGSLQYVMGLLRRLMAHRLVTDEGREFMDKVPDAKSWATLEEDIERLMKHPVWTAEFDRSEKMNAVKEALSKNQDMAEAFGAVGLKLGYVIGADKVSQADLD